MAKVKEHKDLEFCEAFGRMNVVGKILPNNCCFDEEVTESLLPIPEDFDIGAKRIQGMYDQISHIFSKEEILVIFAATGVFQGIISALNGLKAKEGIRYLRESFNVSNNAFTVTAYTDIIVDDVRTCAFVSFRIPKPTFN
jgi:hypothetical protein